MNKRIEEDEDRITEAEEQIQQTGEALIELIKRQTQLESKLTDQEGRSRRDNIRIYRVPEDSENSSSTITFIEKLLKDGLDLDPSRAPTSEGSQRSGAKTNGQCETALHCCEISELQIERRQAWRKGGLKLNNV